MATRALVIDDLEPYGTGDFPTWLAQQAELIRAGRWADVDREHVAEELEDLGKSLWSAYVSALRLNMSHRLKLRYQPERATRSWRDTIVREIANAEESLENYPSFQARREEAMALAYRRARNEAALDTGLPKRTFPDNNPFSWDELMNEVPDLPDQSR